MPPSTVDPKLRRNYYLLILSAISLQITVSTIYMVLPLYFEQFGVNKSGTGVLISIGTFAGIVSGIVAGKFSDNFGRKPFLILGTAMYSIVFFLFAYVPGSFNVFFILRFIEGLGYYIIPVIIVSMAADIFPAKERGRAMALYGMSSGVGQLVGPLTAGYLISAGSYTTYFLFCGGFVVTSLVIMILFVKETLNKEKTTVKIDAGPKMKLGESVKHFLGQVKGLGVVVLVFLIAILFYRVGYTMVDPLFTLYLKDVLKLNISESSYIYALKAICTLAAAPVAGYLNDRVGRKPVFLIGMALTVVTMFSYSQANSIEFVYLIRAVDSVAQATLLTTIRTMMTDLVSPEMRGFGQGLYSSITQESSTIGSIFGGVIIDSWGYTGAFLTAMSLAAIALFVVWSRVPDPVKTVKKEDAIKT
ncbi:MAG: MFS transporter [Candidatus Bathyarchaeota archaeon]|nr:MFS transporter [Candidatus Bathyarchaeota archaeon]